VGVGVGVRARARPVDRAKDRAKDRDRVVQVRAVVERLDLAECEILGVGHKGRRSSEHLEEYAA